MGGFKHVWVLRLRFFLSLFSRVMVLQAGKIVEFDSPEQLLLQKGIFAAMARDAGIVGTQNTAL